MLHYPFYPYHRILPYDESALEHHIEQYDEHREGQPPVGNDRIDLVRDGMPLPSALIRLICLCKRALDECILGIDKRRLQSRAHQLADAGVLLIAGRDDLVPVRQRLHHRLDFLVILKILDGEVSG